MGKRILVTGGAGFLGSHLCERLLEAGHDVLCVDNYFTGTKRQRRGLPRQSALRADAPRRDLPALCRGRRDLQPRLPGLAGPLPARPGADHQDQRPRRHQHARPGQAGARQDLPGLDQRGLWRPDRPPAGRGLSRQRQSAGPARLLRRGQALRRDPVLRLSPPAPAAHQGGAHLQHLRPAHAPQRRPRGVELHRPGAEGRGHHDLRRRHADPRLLLRRRPARRLAAPDGPHARRLHRAGQYRQSGGDADPPPGGEGPEDGERQVEADLPAAAGRRSHAALPGYLAGAREAQLGAQGGPRPGPGEDHRLLRRSPEEQQGRSAASAGRTGAAVPGGLTARRGPASAGR
jgi:hypothetical protein